MNHFLNISSSLLAAVDVAQLSFSEQLKLMNFDWPENGLSWLLYGGGFFLAFVYTIWLYILDTREHSIFWRVWLLFFRIATLATVVLIALNPHIKSTKTIYSPSQVIVVVDVSLSMKEPENLPTKGASPSDKNSATTRSEACVKLLRNSSLINDLRQKHEVLLYTFDSTLNGPHRIFSTFDKQFEEEQRIQKEEKAKLNKQKEGAPSESQEKGVGDDSPLDWKELLRPQGLETAMGEAIRELISTANSPTLSGVVIISDGGSNVGVSPSSVATEAKNAQPTVRIYTVGTGSTLLPKRIQIASIEAPSDVHVGEDTYQIKAFVQTQAMENETLEIKLLRRLEGNSNAPFTEVESRQVRANKDNLPTEIEFEQTPKLEGKFEYVVRATPLKKSNDLGDKPVERSRIINVIKRNISVLMIAGGPTRDYRFARNMLFRHPGVDIDVWLQTVDAGNIATVSQESDDLLVDFPPDFPLRPKADEIDDADNQPKQYDVILAFDVDWSRIDKPDRKKVLNWVGDKSGGIVFVSGEVYTSELVNDKENFKSIMTLHPVVLSSHFAGFQFDNKADIPYKLEFTHAGKNVEFLQLTDEPETSREVWEEFDGIYRSYPTEGKKKGAEVFSYFTSAESETEHGKPIFMASHYYGSGKAMYIGSGEIWRLRSVDDEFFDRFWTKIIREAGHGRLKQGNSLGTPLPERNTYYVGQTITMRVQLMTPQLNPYIAKTTKMNIFTPDGKQMIPAREMREDTQRKGQYIAQFRANELGVYRVEIPVPDSDEIVKARFEVLRPTLETDDPRQNVKVLTDLSRTTSGKYFKFANVVQDLPNQLQAKSQKTFIDEQPETLWDRMFFMWLLLGLLAVEWLTRKLLKLA